MREISMYKKNHVPPALLMIEKTFELLEILSSDRKNATLPELAATVGMSRTKTLNLLNTLNSKGMVEANEKTGQYHLGLEAITLSRKILTSDNIILYAHSVIEELARKHDEAVYLTVDSGSEVLFLDMVDCEQQIKASPLIGKRFHSFSNAAGMVMKALESRDLWERLIKKKGRKGTDTYDFDALESELQKIRTTGVAVDNGGLGDGIITVAVAVRDYAGQAVGAIAMLGPSFRMLTERVEQEIIPSMVREANLLSQKFGYAPSVVTT
jgi:DNA-binding IclR family transcriptional regulator